MGLRLSRLLAACLLGALNAGVHAGGFTPSLGEASATLIVGQTRGELEVTAPYARARVAPRDDAAFLLLLKRGERVPLIRTQGSWHMVALKDTVGWVSGTETLVRIAPGTASPKRSAAETPQVPSAPRVISTPNEEKPPPDRSAAAKAPPTDPTPVPPQTRRSRPSAAAAPPPRRSPTVRAGTPAVASSRASDVPLGNTEADNAAHPSRPSPLAEAPRRPEQLQYAQVLVGPVRVLAEVSPDSPILGMINKGTNHPIVSLGDSWIRIQYRDTTGWVERRYIQVVERPSVMVFLREFLIVFAVVVGLLLLSLIIKVIAERRNQVRSGWVKTVSVQKNLLLVARDEKLVQRYLADTTTTLGRCFSEVGFKVTRARSSSEVTKLLAHYRPDVVAVDWDIDPGIYPWVERALNTRASISNVFTLFYNVPDSAALSATGTIPNAQYLGAAFSDREVFSVVTPQVITGERPAKIRKSVETSALEGSIERGSLAEVFQFVEIGHKSGCLLVERQKPFGIIYFRDGIIVYAASTRSSGEKSVFEMLDLDEGRFRFVMDRETKTPNCSIPTLGILMEWTRLSDEAARG